MKVELKALAPDDEVAAKLLHRALERWRDVVVLKPADETPHARLTIATRDEASASVAARRGVLLDEVVNLAGSTLEEAWFRVNAKLGRLSRSDDVARAPFRIAPRRQMARRELFALLRGDLLTRSEAPLPDDAVCEAGLGCDRCIKACPSGSLAVRDGVVIAIDRDTCVGCGVCVAACPVGAIEMPAFSSDGFAGLLDAIDESSAPQKTLVLTCHADAVTPEPWMVVESVPSVGMVGLRWLALAATSTLGVLGVLCTDASCEGREHVRSAAEAISRVLAGRPPRVVYAEGASGWGLIREAHASSSPGATPRTAAVHGNAWDRYAARIAALAPAGTPASQLGFSTLEVAAGCTLCGACAASCRHGSIDLPQTGVLRFDASSCTGCGHCVRVCPEHALTLSSPAGEISSTLQPVIIHRDEVINCSGCGAPMQAAGLFHKVSAQVGTAAPAIEYCSECNLKLALGIPLR
jgi:ferredoxin